MIEVTIKVKFTSLKRAESKVSAFELAEAISNIIDPSCPEEWSVHGDMLFQRLKIVEIK